MVVRYRLDSAPVIVDVGGGYGGGVTIRLKDNGIEPVSFVASWESIEKTKDGRLAFANKRAEVWWKFREALDPDQPDGSAIALPADPELRADLCAPTWKLTARGILLESKDGSSGFGNLRQRLGRSPGKGDAVVMAWSEGNAAAVSRHNAWKWERKDGSGGLSERPKREAFLHCEKQAVERGHWCPGMFECVHSSAQSAAPGTLRLPMRPN